jgi:DNA polymerase III subunit gamma/tau
MVTGSTGSYTVLARRFRPQGFADVVGQEHIARALRNAILANRVAHAYLFTGARGVGKTSTARILAKALNCPKSVDGNPCNDCEICDGIAAGNDVDVLEIDGASNNGVDNIRQLRSNVNVSSMRSRFKVYIIDEVHMLSTSAFNALLKTLEEPPPNVKFVFCTTEPHKIPDTILSRCQRFDFGTIETSNIKARLAHIAEAEGVAVHDEALELVARRAAGSMRDSQSIFDQLLAFGEENISAADVHRLLGTASDDRLIDIGQALVDRDKAKAIDSFHAALDGGVQLGELTDQLLFYLRDLMILASKASSVDLLSVAPVSRELLQQQAETWGLETIVAAMQILSDAKGRMQRVTYGRALAELALIRIAMLEELTGIGELIDRLRSDEPATATQSQASSPAAEKKNEIALSDSQIETSSPRELPQEAVVAPAPEPQSGSFVIAPSVASNESRDADSSTVAEKSPASVAESPVRIVSASTELAATKNSPRQSESEAGRVVAQDASKPSGQSAGDGLSNGVDLVSGVQTRDFVPATSDTVLSEPPVAETAEVQPLETGAAEVAIRFLPKNAAEIWARVVPEISDMLKSHVKSVSRVAISAPNKLVLTLPAKYHFGKTYLEKPEAQSRLQKIIARLTGLEPRITIVLSEDGVEEVPAAGLDRRSSKRVFKPEEDEFVCSVVEVFSAQVVRIDPLVGGARNNE